MDKDYKFKIPKDIQEAINFRQQNPKLIYSDTRTKELKEVQDKNRQINQNLDNYAVSNFWTQPYQNLGSKSAINLGSNLVKESIYTGVGEAIGKIASYLTKLRKNRTQSIFRNYEKAYENRSMNVDLFIQRKKEAIDYITSPELRARLQKIDKRFGTSYEDALQMYLDNYKNGKELLNIEYDPNLEVLGESTNNLLEPFDLDQKIIRLGKDYTFDTIEHEFKHYLEFLESAIRLKKQGQPLTPQNIRYNATINPRNYELFYSNIYTPDEVNKIHNKVKQNIPMKNILEDFEYLIKSPTEANSQLSSIIKQRFVNGKYNEPIKSVEELQDLARKAANQNSSGGLRIINGFIRDKQRFLDNFNNWMYQVPPFKHDNEN